VDGCRDYYCPRRYHHVLQRSPPCGASHTTPLHHLPPHTCLLPFLLAVYAYLFAARTFSPPHTTTLGRCTPRSAPAVAHGLPVYRTLHARSPPPPIPAPTRCLPRWRTHYCTPRRTTCPLHDAPATLPPARAPLHTTSPTLLYPLSAGLPLRIARACRHRSLPCNEPKPKIGQSPSTRSTHTPTASPATPPPQHLPAGGHCSCCPLPASYCHYAASPGHAPPTMVVETWVPTAHWITPPPATPPACIHAGHTPHHAHTRIFFTAAAQHLLSSSIKE